MRSLKRAILTCIFMSSFIALDAFSRAVPSSEAYEGSNLSLSYGHWTVSPTQKGTRYVYLNYKGQKIDYCIQENISYQGRIVIDNSNCEYFKAGVDGVLVFDINKGNEILQEYLDENKVEEDHFDNQLF